MDAKIIVLGQMDNGDGTFEMQNRVYSQYGISPTLNTFGGGTRNLRFCVKKSIIQLGNILPTSTRDNPNQGRVYSVFGIAPCLTNLSRGGGREPMIIWEENYE